MTRKIRLTIAVLLLGTVNVAYAGGEACLIEGITVRWAMSYCMIRFETDDEVHPDVSACFSAELTSSWSSGADENCDANLAYKSAICSISIENKAYDGALSKCILSDDMIPTVVTDGVGG